MKRIFNILTAATAVSFVLAGCTKEQNAVDDLQSTLKMRTIAFDATIEGNDTKAALGEDNIIYWSGLDSIRVYEADSTKDRGYRFVSSIDEPSVDFKFTGEIPVNYHGGFFASYPCGTDEKYTQDYGLFDRSGIKTLVLPWSCAHLTDDDIESYSSAIDGTFDPQSAILVARSEGADSLYAHLKFRSALAYIKLKTDFTCTAITIEGKNGETLTCSILNVTFDEDGNPVAVPSDLSIGFKYACLKNLKNSRVAADIPAGTYYIPVLPQTLDYGFTITFKGVNGYHLTATRSTDKTATLTRGKILNLGTMEFATLDREEGDFLGKGTAANPYLISSKADLELLASKLKAENETEYCSKYYLVTNDIDCGGSKLTPIGSGTYFKGHFNGGGHTIKNYIASTAVVNRYETDEFHEDRCGLFYGIYEATIENLNAVVSDIELNFTESTGSVYQSLSPFIGGAFNSTVRNCHVSGTNNFILRPGQYEYMDVHKFGGLIAETFGPAVIENCSNGVTMSVEVVDKFRTDDYSIGGIVGYCHPYGDESVVRIDRCRNTGNLQVIGHHDLEAGGIVGYAVDKVADDIDLAITNCVNSGNISAGVKGEQSTFADNAMAGGIAGYLDTDGGDNDPYIYNCLNKGNIYAYQCDAWSGGLVGYVYDDDTHIFRCASCGEVTVKDGENLNPLVGNNNGTYKDLLWTQTYFDNYYHLLTGAIMNEFTLSDISGWSEYLRNPGKLVDWIGEWTAEGGSRRSLDLDF